jgi:triphosphoribosyl-dephospho-CoA synthase
MRPPDHLSFIGAAAWWACVLEVCAPKPGNVHPGAAFADVTWLDFIRSADAVAPWLDRAATNGVGDTVLACVRATQHAVGRNTNLGIILLLTPLCAAAASLPLHQGVTQVLEAMTMRDARLVYQAIREARPGGLGAAGAADVREPPSISLRDAMKLAADRDAVARQYANGFADALGPVADDLAAPLPLPDRIVRAHLRQMARLPDTLIGRKCGMAVAEQSQRRAAAVLTAGTAMPQAMADLDAWLRADGHRRNPGATADLVAAGLFVNLRRGVIAPPFPWATELLDSCGC